MHLHPPFLASLASAALLLAGATALHLAQKHIQQPRWKALAVYAATVAFGLALVAAVTLEVAPLIIALYMLGSWVLMPGGGKSNVVLVWLKRRRQRRGESCAGLWSAVNDDYYWAWRRRRQPGMTTELEAAAAPAGRGTEPVAAATPEGRGDELESADEGGEPEHLAARQVRPAPR